MRATKKQPSDPLLFAIEQELRPGHYIRYNDASYFVSHLQQVEEKLAALVKVGEAERAVGLYEVFVAGCYEKIEECDDSGANLSMFWEWLFCGWIKARQEAGRPASETVQQILKWKENDDYGFCYKIDNEVAKVLDPEAYEMFVAHYRKIVDEGLASLLSQKPGAISEYDNSIRLPAISLKDIYQAKGDAFSYAALCESMGLSPRDCERLAEMEKANRRWSQALSWVEKGLALEPTRNWHNEGSFSLKYMKPELLRHLGRKEDALAQSWDDFKNDPSESSYDDFMRYVPKKDKVKWHDQAMEVAMNARLGPFMELCVKTKEWLRLATRIHEAKHEELEAISHYYSEVAATGILKRDGAAAAKLYRAMGFRILNAKKSKYYSNALSSFESARNLYRKAGMESEWDALIKAVRAQHRGKYGFMPGFEHVVSGVSIKGPSFVERARARWQK